MAQIVVRGIDDTLMAVFKANAKAKGKSTEQAVRDLIEESVRGHEKKLDWIARADAVRERLHKKYGDFPDSLDVIRAERSRE